MANKLERYVFIWAVFNVGITCYAAGGEGGILPWYYTVKYPLMVGSRFVLYKNKQWHWFLLDFCYFANALLLIWLWIYPNKILFSMVFAICNGPLLWAIFIFNNQLVLHSVAKTTSLLIHLTPGLITYCLRWENPEIIAVWDVNDRWRDGMCEDTSLTSDTGCAQFTHMIFYPFLFLVAHQLLYYILIQHVFRSRIVANANSLTTYRYLFKKENQRGLKWKIVNCMGRRFRIFIFGFFFLVYSTVSFFPSMLFYRSHWAHLAILMFACLVAIKNGSDFYAKVYTKKPRKNKVKKMINTNINNNNKNSPINSTSTTSTTEDSSTVASSNENSLTAMSSMRSYTDRDGTALTMRGLQISDIGLDNN
jgi:hypothetical protein